MITFIKVAVVFAVLIYLLRRKMDVGWVMFISAGILGALFGMGPLEICRVAVRASLDPSTLMLIAVLVLVAALEMVMRENGLLALLVTSSKALIKDQRITAAVLPMVVGLLPSAGGARFSAPMVDEVARSLAMSNERKALVNYWFRHIAEYVLPVYSGIILTAEVFEVSTTDLMKTFYPLPLAAVTAGVLWLLRGVRPIASAEAAACVTPEAGLDGLDPVPRRQETWTHLKNLLVSMTPIAVAIGLVLWFGLHPMTSMGIVVAALLAIYGYKLQGILKVARRSLSLRVILLVMGVFVFKEMLMASGAVDGLSAFMQDLGVPVIAVVVALPMFVGIATGLNASVVAASFPIIAGLMAAEGVQGVDLQYVAVAFASGASGTMLSPVHLCLILTAEYFGVDLYRMIKAMIAPQSVVLGVALALHWLF